MKKQTAVEWLEERLILSFGDEIKPLIGFFIIAKEMDKEQSIGLIKQTAMFMAASHLDEEIANMSYEDVYKTYYQQTYGGGNK